MIGEREFQYAALRLTHHDGVDGAMGRFESRAVIEEIEEVEEVEEVSEPTVSPKSGGSSGKLPDFSFMQGKTEEAEALLKEISVDEYVEDKLLKISEAKRIMIEFDTSKGTMQIRITMNDPIVQKLVELCQRQ